MLTLFDHTPRKQVQGLSWMRPRRTQVYAIAWIDDGTLVTSGGDGLVRIWDAADGSERHRYDIRAAGFWLPLSHSVCSLSVARRRSCLAHASQDGTLRCYSTVVDAAARHEYAGKDLCVVSFSPSEALLACGHASGEIRVYAVDDALLLTERNDVPLLWRDALAYSLKGHDGALKRRSLAWLDDGTLVSAGTDERLRIFDLATGGRCVFRSWLERRPKARRRRLIRSSNGGDLDLEMRFGGRDVAHVPPCLAVSPTASIVATCSEQGARLWTFGRRDGRRAFAGVKPLVTAHRLGAKSVEFTPDGLCLAMIEFADENFTSSRTVVTVWSVRTGLFERAFDPAPGPRELYNDLALSGGRLAVTRSDGTALAWEIPTQRSALVKCLLNRAAPRPTQTSSPVAHLLFRLVDHGIASCVLAYFA